MKENSSTRDALTVPFPEEVLGEINKSGRRLTYAPVAEVIARLNMVLGTENWSEISSEVWRDTINNDWVIAKVELEATIDGKATKKIGYGGQKIKFYAKGDNAGEPLDLGDDFKGAHSDAFKKAAQQLGVGLELARKEEALEIEEKQKIARSIEEDSEGKPLASAEALKLIKDRINTLEAPQKKALKTWWATNIYFPLDSGKITEEQAEKVLSYLG